MSEVAPTTPPVVSPTESKEIVVKVVVADPAGECLTLDPINQCTGEIGEISNMVFNRLTDMDGDWNVIPELAVSWESNAAATEWTYHLRQGVKFHNGKEMTSADVVWTFKRLWSIPRVLATNGSRKRHRPTTS